MTGSARLFTETAGHFLDVAQHGTTGDDRHYCTRFHSNDGILGNARELHLEYRGLPDLQ
jgi:hypothetical protein